MSVFGVILVRIFPAFSRIWTEYGDIPHISPYSVRISENAGKMRIRIPPNMDTFSQYQFYSVLTISYELLKQYTIYTHFCVFGSLFSVILG